MENVIHSSSFKHKGIYFKRFLSFQEDGETQGSEEELQSPVVELAVLRQSAESGSLLPQLQEPQLQRLAPDSCYLSHNLT